MSEDKKIFRRAILIAFSSLALIWAVFGIEWAMGWNLAFLGIRPFHLEGLIGIITSPLIHGDLNHIINNSWPLVGLMFSLFYFYPKLGPKVLPVLYLVTGFWVWVAAGDAYHIGASGVIYAIAGFLIFSGFFRKERSAIVVGLSIIVLYGGLAQGIFPTEEGVSWESHLFGALAGASMAWYYRKSHLKPKKKYAWEMEENDLVDEGSWNYPGQRDEKDIEFWNYDDRHYTPGQEFPEKPEAETPPRRPLIFRYRLIPRDEDQS